MFCVSPYFCSIMGIHFSHVLRIVWIFASREMYKKHLTLGCSTFPYYRNSLSAMFWGQYYSCEDYKKLFPIPSPLKRLCETPH